jgi:hypothetical protein
MKKAPIDFASIHADKFVQETIAALKKLPHPAKPIAVAQFKRIFSKIKSSPQYRKRVKKPRK